MVILDEVDPSPEHHVLPAVHVGSAAGATILAYMKKFAANPTAMLYPTTVVGVQPSPVVASFSSRGPSMYNPQILKPDISAPGVFVLGAWQQNSSASGIPTDPTRIKFNILSGTSMACPHISGLAALLRGAHPTWSPAMIKSALMITASIMDNRTPSQLCTDQWTSGTATEFDYGAGHVMPELAVNPGLVYDISPNDYVNSLCAVGYTSNQCQIFTGVPVTCPANPSPRVNYPTFSATFHQREPKTARCDFHSNGDERWRPDGHLPSRCQGTDGSDDRCHSDEVCLHDANKIVEVFSEGDDDEADGSIRESNVDGRDDSRAESNCDHSSSSLERNDSFPFFGYSFACLGSSTYSSSMRKKIEPKRAWFDSLFVIFLHLNIHLCFYAE